MPAHSSEVNVKALLSDSGDIKGTKVEERAPPCLQSSVMLCHLSDAKRDFTLMQSPATFLHDPAHGASPQRQSHLFQLCLELREKIYSVVLSSHSPARFVESAACGCFNCNERRRMPVGTKPSAISTTPTRGDRKLAMTNFFLVCRRVYDEARPIFHQVNSLYIDARSNIQHYLLTLSMSFTTHRGMTSPILKPGYIPIHINLVFAFNAAHHVDDSSYYHGPSELQILKDFESALRSLPSMHIHKLDIAMHLRRQIPISDYVPLLRALHTLPSVHSGTMTIELRTPFTSSENDIIAAIAAELTAALHAPASPDCVVISAFDAFEKAKSRVRTAALQNEACYYTTKLELESLRNYLLDDVVRTAQHHASGQDKEVNVVEEDMDERAREDYELLLMFGDAVLGREGLEIEVA